VNNQPLHLSGKTRPFAVLGHPIGHSLSPVMHNASFRTLGLDAVYLAFDVHPDRLLGVLPAMRDMGFGGVNLTVPLKEVAFRGLSDLDESARRVGAVNTVEFLPDGSLRGHNTDGAGFLLALVEAFGGGVRGLNVFIAGCGGAGRCVAITCAEAGARTVTLADADAVRPPKVAAEITAMAPSAVVRAMPADAKAWVAAARGADLVVQATPVGMRREDGSPLPAEAFRPGQMAYDLVYMYPETAFMRAAAGAGARASNGLGMLLHQGARAFSIWTGRDADVQSMRTALEQAVYGKNL
jgi:shikimate dehydrogenase